MRKSEGVILLFILLVAAFFRFYRLDEVPPGFQFDEGFNATDALRVINGERPIFLEANGGREVLYTYLQALFVYLFGPDVFALRLTSAVVGVLTIPLAYFFVKALFSSAASGGESEARRMAALTALLVAISYWHIHFSRYGIRVITLPPLVMLVFYYFWRGVERKQMAPFALSGFFLGLATYAHPASRLLPLVLVSFTLYMIVSRLSLSWTYVKGLSLTAVIALIIFLPLGRYFWNNREAFTGHAEAVSIFAPRVSEGGVGRTLALHVLRVGGMFFLRGDEEWIHNLPGRPVFDPLIALFFIAGVGMLLWGAFGRGVPSCRRQISVFLLLWSLVMPLPSVFSDAAPNFSRSMGAIPAIFVFPALSMSSLWQWATDRRRLLAMSIVLVAALGLSALLTFRHYFVTFANSPQLYYRFGVDMMDVAEYVNRETRSNHVYLAPLWAQEGTVAFLTRDSPLKSFESSDAIVLPSRGGGMDALYAFPLEQRWHIDRFGQALAGLVEKEEVQNRYGDPLLIAYRLRDEDLPDPDDPLATLLRPDFPLLPDEVQRVNLADQVELLGYSVEKTAQAGQAFTVNLFWQARRKIAEDYTVFVHVLDEGGRIWGQQDKRPANGSYPTTTWEVGDVIVDSYHPWVEPCAPPGQYRLVVGMYSLATGERLHVAGTSQTAITLGSLPIKRAQGLKAEDVSPQYHLEAGLGPGLRLLGYDRGPRQVRPGELLPLTLYWQVTADGDALAHAFRETGGSERAPACASASEEQPISIRLRDAKTGETRELWRSPGTLPVFQRLEGEVVCDYHDLSIPPDLPAGQYQLEVGLEGERGVVLWDLVVVASTRRFALPNPQYPMQVDLGNQVAFLGYDLDATSVEPGGVLHLTLYWQARARMERSYTVFTHLLDSQDRIWGQKDNIPVRGTYPTTLWVEGEVVVDEYEIVVQPDAPAGQYIIEVGMYELETGERLPVLDDRGRVEADKILLPVEISVAG